MIFQSTKDKSKKGKPHYHVVLTPDLSQQDPQNPLIPNDQNSVVGLKFAHQHPIEFFDAETGDVVLGEVNGHTHTFNVSRPIEDTKLPDVENSKDERTRTYKTVFKRAAQNDSKSIENGAKAYKYIEQDNNQWEDDTKTKLNKEGRPALMFDQISPNTDKIIGHFVQDIPDPALYPVEKGDEKITDILTVVLKHIFRQSGKDELAEAVFSDEFIAGRGVWEILLDFSTDIGGDIIVESPDYKSVLTGPHTKLDLSDCEDMFRVRYLSKNQGEMEFGETFEKAIEKAAYQPMDLLASTGYDYNTWYKTPGHQWDAPAAKQYPDNLTDLEKSQIIFPIIDWYRKVYFKEYIFRGMDGLNAPIRLKAGDAKQLKDAGVPTADRTSFSVEKTCYFSDEELERIDTGFDRFPFRVAYGKKTAKGWRGKVYGAIDMQDEVNKRSSQMTEVVNKMAGYNYFFDGETFGTTKEEEKFMNQSSIPGSAFKVRDINNIPVKSEGVKFPVEVLNLEQNALQRMDMYFGGVLNVEEAGKLGSRGLMLQERTALKINELFFKHYENGFIQLNKDLIGFIQKFYPPHKILRIIRSAPTNEQEQAFQQMQDGEIIKLLSTTDLTKYDMAVGVVKSSPTFKESQTEMLKEMMGQGAAIPLEYFVDQSSLPNKDMLLQMLQQQNQAQAEAQEKTNNSEVMKTLTAKIPEGSPIIPLLMKEAGYDIQAMQQGLQGGQFNQQGPPPSQPPIA